MALYLVGLGLYDEKDITIRGKEAVSRCEKVYLESYTSSLCIEKEKLAEFLGMEIHLADRDLVENRIESEILEPARDSNIALLVVGDPFAATTHIDIRLRALKMGTPVEVIHNASVITAVGIIGLEIYKYGKTTSIPFENSEVMSPVNVYRQNKEQGLHTLFLLDLKPREKMFMSASDAASYLKRNKVDENIMAIGCAGLGSPGIQIKARTLKQMVSEPFTRFPQCLVLPGNLHFMEEEALSLWK